MNKNNSTIDLPSDTVSITRDYYNSKDADNFYEEVWGGEDIHIGIYKDENISIKEASRLSMEHILKKINLPLTSKLKILDIGSGYGGAARFLAGKIGAEITCLNLSAEENETNHRKNLESELSEKIEIFEGNFEEMPFEDAYFDIVWSQDAILHSGNKRKVFQEVNRVLKNGGEFIFTDPMQSPNCPPGVLGPIYERIHLKGLGSVHFYNELAQELGWKNLNFEDLSLHLTYHYSRIRNQVLERKLELSNKISMAFLEKMAVGLSHWINGGKSGYLSWGILHFQKL